MAEEFDEFAHAVAHARHRHHGGTGVTYPALPGIGSGMAGYSTTALSPAQFDDHVDGDLDDVATGSPAGASSGTVSGGAGAAAGGIV